jgi:hypothetical protein
MIFRLSIYFAIGLVVGSVFHFSLKKNTTNPEVDLTIYSLWGQTALATLFWPFALYMLIKEKWL